MKNYICKIATIEEMNKKWDYEISIATKKEKWDKKRKTMIVKKVFQKFPFRGIYHLMENPIKTLINKEKNI